MQNVTYTWTKAGSRVLRGSRPCGSTSRMAQAGHVRHTAAFRAAGRRLADALLGGPYVAILTLHYLIRVFRGGKTSGANWRACVDCGLLCRLAGLVVGVLWSRVSLRQYLVTDSRQYAGSLAHKIKAHLYDSIVPWWCASRPCSTASRQRPATVRDDFFLFANQQ